MVVHNLFDEITRIDNLITSWKEFRISKKDRRDTIEFERNLEDNLWELHQKLADKTYRHSGYSSFFVQDPKLRHIHKALVRDRVLHHAIVKHINPIFEKTFIHDSYSCRKDKGTHRGVEQLIGYGRMVSKNNTRPCWILKCDIRKFFASVDQKILIDMVFERIRGIHTRRLLEEVISSFSSDRTVDSDEPKGLPIGNLTSQLFANVYLNELDQFMKHGLHEKHYIRYADDFVILHPQREHCFEIQDLIKDFLKERLKLELHPNKITVRKLGQGVDFLGYICFPNFVIPRIKTKNRTFNKIHKNILLYRRGRLGLESLNQSIYSYLGILSHSNSFELKQELENQIFFWLTE
ncbi:MAG: reverse transcriptase/maturase family protein [Candidatus Taylorbacteria bacterium]|nr:reverse transcriptase/maturase family protein [Candidatus Taylorbacteria bacterium]